MAARNDYNNYRRNYDKACQHVNESGEPCGQHRRDHNGFAPRDRRVLDHAFEYEPPTEDET